MQKKVSYIKCQIIQMRKNAQLIIVNAYQLKVTDAVHVVLYNGNAELSRIWCCQSYDQLEVYSQATVTRICRGSDSGVRWSAIPCYRDSES